MKKLVFILLISYLAIKVNAQTLCPNEFNCGDTLIDSREGNKYPTVQIGTQCWLAVNLYETKYLNGDIIPNVAPIPVWDGLTTGAWCNYDNSLSNGATYGHLYNGYVVHDSRGLCPKGWYVPDSTEWIVLTTYLGGLSNCGQSLKSTSGWSSVQGTNTTGFNGLPGGSRGTYDGAETYTDYSWTTTPGLLYALHCCENGCCQCPECADLEGPAPLWSGCTVRCFKYY